MSQCDNCGRGDGHYMGCAEVAQPFVLQKRADAPDPEEHMAELLAQASQCAFEDCTNTKRPKGRGAVPKYCVEHGDPKNRK